jgi:hypothetical protein
MSNEQTKSFSGRLFLSILILSFGGVFLISALFWNDWAASPISPPPIALPYKPRQNFDRSGFSTALADLQPWPENATLEEIAHSWIDAPRRSLELIDQNLSRKDLSDSVRFDNFLKKAAIANFEGNPRKAYSILEQLRSWLEGKDDLATKWLYTVIYYQGLTALRCGENENCVLCQGESSCILPIAPSAIHLNPSGSRQAIGFFIEYLEKFPNDIEARWLLNVAHMTLGEHPEKVDPRFSMSIEGYRRSEFDIGKFRDISNLVKVDRFNMSGGAMMEDFDNDGLLDIVVTSMDPTQSMAFYRNKGDGTFEDRTKAAGLVNQLGGMNCVQADYNNDGHMDFFICRGAWFSLPMRPSLLRNNGDGTFTDVTLEAGLGEPVNTISATWADYDNDGFLDLFICCERQLNRLYHNKGDGTFEEVAFRAGVLCKNEHCKGAAWIDFDNDGYPDLYVNYLNGPPQLFHNNRDGTFTDVTKAMGITGPQSGFSCWAWDFDNDGWLDIFALSRDNSLADIVTGLQGGPTKCGPNKLYRNLGGKGFQDVTAEAGLETDYAAMGSNFADFDGDGFLDFYLGTGDPSLDTLVPNRMIRNVEGRRFVDITGPSGTGHLQKGHGVACGDWRRTGKIDLFIQMGGAVPGDRFHNLLFLNPGHGNNWLTVKLIGRKTNRAAIGARIKVVAVGEKPLTVYRHVSSGSSFGANPLQQTIGLAKSNRIATLEIYWPTSKSTQVFHDINVNQSIEITEFANDYRKLNWSAIPLPN